MVRKISGLALLVLVLLISTVAVIASGIAHHTGVVYHEIYPCSTWWQERSTVVSTRYWLNNSDGTTPHEVYGVPKGFTVSVSFLEEGGKEIYHRVWRYNTLEPSVTLVSWGRDSRVVKAVFEVTDETGSRVDSAGRAYSKECTPDRNKGEDCDIVFYMDE